MSITKALSEIMGTKEQVAMDLMDKFSNNLIDVMHGNKQDYIKVMGIGEVAARRLVEAFRLHTYICGTAKKTAKKISDALDVWNVLKDEMRTLEHEEFKAVLLGGRNEVLEIVDIAKGQRDSCVVHSSDVFRAALMKKACSIILVHNHPSGDPSPSPEDCAMTRKVVSGGALIGISVLDHVIIGESGYTSLREEGLIN